ncbi:hypothetical protein D3C76_982270 [compost metagenome]
MPVLLNADAIALLFHRALHVVQVGRVMIAFATNQQVQVRLSSTGNHPGSVQDLIRGLMRIHHHQAAANCVHDRLPVREYSFIQGHARRLASAPVVRQPLLHTLTNDLIHTTAKVESRPLNSIVND